MRSGISLGRSTVEMTIWLSIGLALATLVTCQQHFYTNGRYGKRHDPLTASSFWSGSRYGRSGNADGLLKSVNEEDKKIDAGDDVSSKDVELSPRMDRFFLGSRYGKRGTNAFANDLHRSSAEIESLKYFETAASLDFLLSIGHLHRGTDKENLKILNQQLKEDAMRSDEDDNSKRNDNVSLSSASSSDGLVRTFASALSENGFACLYTGVTNLYRCFNRKSYKTEGSSD